MRWHRRLANASGSPQHLACDVVQRIALGVRPILAALVLHDRRALLLDRDHVIERATATLGQAGQVLGLRGGHEFLATSRASLLKASSSSAISRTSAKRSGKHPWQMQGLATISLRSSSVMVLISVMRRPSGSAGAYLERPRAATSSGAGRTRAAPVASGVDRTGPWRPAGAPCSPSTGDWSRRFVLPAAVRRTPALDVHGLSGPPHEIGDLREASSAKASRQRLETGCDGSSWLGRRFDTHVALVPTTPSTASRHGLDRPSRHPATSV